MAADQKDYAWVPDQSIHDNASATYNAVGAVWKGDVEDINCFFHLQQNFFGHKANIKFEEASNAIMFRADVRKIANEIQFKDCVDDAIDLLLEKWCKAEPSVCTNFRQYYGTATKKRWQRLFGTNSNNALENYNRHLKTHLLKWTSGGPLMWGVLLPELMDTVKGQSLEQMNSVWPSDPADFDEIARWNGLKSTAYHKKLLREDWKSGREFLAFLNKQCEPKYKPTHFENIVRKQASNGDLERYLIVRRSQWAVAV